MNRLFGVMWIYLTRPLCWVLFVVIAACLVVGASMPLEKYEHYDSYTSSKTKNIFVGSKNVYSQDKLNEALEERDGKPVAVSYDLLASDLQYKNLKVDSTGVPRQVVISDSEAAERLRQLTFPKSTQWLETGDLKVQQSTIDQLGIITSLEHVKLVIPKSSSTPLDLSPLAKLVNLKSLDLGYITDIDSLKPLQSLPHLKTLTIADFSFVTSKNMREVAAIKSLRQLFLPNIANDSPSLDALSELNGASLKQVYFANAVADTAKLEAVGKIIPEPTSSIVAVPAWSISERHRIRVVGADDSLDGNPFFSSVYASRRRTHARLSIDSTTSCMGSDAGLDLADSLVLVGLQNRPLVSGCCICLQHSFLRSLCHSDSNTDDVKSYGGTLVWTAYRCWRDSDL